MWLYVGIVVVDIILNYSLSIVLKARKKTTQELDKSCKTIIKMEVSVEKSTLSLWATVIEFGIVFLSNEKSNISRTAAIRITAIFIPLLHIIKLYR